jgi:hypothetical protein
VAPAEVYRRSLIRPPRSPLRQSWAERYFPGEPAVGKQLYEGGDTTQAVTVIGVVGDVKYDGLQAVGDDVFVAVSQGAGGNALYAIVRTPTDPLALARPMQRVLQEIDPTLLPTEVATMQSLLADSLGGERHWASVIAGFALAAVLLAALGVFGVLAYHVANRTREIGIRQALGADDRRIVRMVLQRGLTCAAGDRRGQRARRVRDPRPRRAAVRGGSHGSGDLAVRVRGPAAGRTRGLLAAGEARREDRSAARVAAAVKWRPAKAARPRATSNWAWSQGPTRRTLRHASKGACHTVGDMKEEIGG